jgi:hypothetical protein
MWVTDLVSPRGRARHHGDRSAVRGRPGHDEESCGPVDAPLARGRLLAHPTPKSAPLTAVRPWRGFDDADLRQDRGHHLRLRIRSTALPAPGFALPLAAPSEPGLPRVAASPIAQILPAASSRLHSISFSRATAMNTLVANRSEGGPFE